ncbi:MAG: tetratricopeptide repeat protein [Planctomycetaceae bacterium]|nr:tetratricopeptide repeat protein [Planctomycetaceae bacterium]
MREQFNALENPGARSFQSVEQEAGRLKELLALDPDYAALHFRLGQCQLAQNQLEAARQSFVRAKELDVCPLRILEPMHEIILRTSANLDLPLVDVKAIFEQASEQGIAGDAMLIDHVHPTIRSHQLIAERLADKMQALGWLEITRPDWMEQRQQAYLSQLESLDFMYFQRGKDRLRGLQRWARGEAQAERPEQ